MEIRKNLWMKFIVMAITALAGACTLICVVGTLLIGFEWELQGSKKDYEDLLYKRALRVYAADFFMNANLRDAEASGTMTKECMVLNGGNILYTLVRKNGDGTPTTDETTTIVYTNDGSVTKKDSQAALEYSFTEHYTYNIASAVGLIRGHSFYQWWEEGKENLPHYVMYMRVRENPQKNLTLANGREDYLPEVKELADICYAFTSQSGWWTALGMIVFLIGFLYLMTVAGYHKGKEGPQICALDKLPLGLFLGALIVAEGFLMLAFGYAVFEVLPRTMIATWLVLGFAGGVAWIGVILGLIFCMSIAVRIKTNNFARYTICYYLFAPFEWMVKLARERSSLFAKILWGFFLIFVAELLILIFLLEMCYGYVRDAYIGLFLGIKLISAMIEVPILCYIAYQLKLIKAGGERLAAGDYSTPIDTTKMLFDFKKHASNLNQVSEGVSMAVEARMKSERFKTELITNVSHDIKTPLTSIINYVDLIKKEHIDHPVVTEYVEVLDRQSARLKKLIEDLMEASKASTGNISVNLEKMDEKVLLGQVVGEFEERAEAGQLEIVLESPENPVYIMADGRHLWRVLDNLMSNICKYAMPRTRVYINLESYHGMAIMTFRNISKAKLNIESSELLERFVRGDSSRNTEGNGLGLNIAQSLTNLMNGNLAVQIDGDLFKVIVSFDEVRNETTDAEAN